MNDCLHNGHHCQSPHQHVDKEMELILKVYRYAKQLGNRLDAANIEDVMIDQTLTADSKNPVSSKAVFDAIKELKDELSEFKKEFNCLKGKVIEHLK